MINSTTENRGLGSGTALDAWRPVLVGTTIVLLLAALYRVPQDAFRMVFEPLGTIVSFDVISRHTEVRAWFTGEPVYGVIESADYPPASYPMLFLIIGWGMSAQAARFSWALTSLIALAWLSVQAWRISGGPKYGRLFVLSAVLSHYAVASSIRIGQAGVYLIALLLASVALFVNVRRTRTDSIKATAYMLLALAKPTFTAPIVWLVAFFGGIVPFVSLIVSYVALTMFAASFQSAPLPALISGWLDQRGLVEFVRAYGNVHTWLGRMGYGDWILSASLAILAAAGWWTYRVRHADPWLVFGVLAAVARLWSYHRWYDDMLLIPMFLAVYRIACSERAGSRLGHLAVALMLGLGVLGASPSSFLRLATPWGDLYKATQTMSILTGIAFLVWRIQATSGMTRETPALASEAA